ncbi:uncharacterized protein LOC132744590 [Ruditapes philippinarum]|uniref:uncharacterized protein LOC132744590 n=1 Tax=Ruditapes philippinarum TaxID=129788 RepID=UPI00295B882A|nr:uncharacterized protein LOC132744590 [Ruditapes philippinarum]
MDNWTIIIVLILARQTFIQADSNHTFTDDYPGTEGHGAIMKDDSNSKEIIAAAVIGIICFVLLAMLLLYYKFGDRNITCYTKDDHAAKADQDFELKEIFITDPVEGGSDNV